MILLTLLVTSVSLATTWAIVTTVLEKALSAYNIQLSGQLPTFSSVVADLTGSKAVNKQQPNETITSTQPTPKPDSSSISGPKPEDALPVWNDASASTSRQDSMQKKLVMSADDLAKKKDQLSAEDKQRILSILAKLPADEMQKISLWMEEGITEDELKQMEELVQKRLKPEEMAQLTALLKN